MLKMRNLLHKTIRILSTSAILSIVLAVIGIIYAFFTLGHMSLTYAFTVGFAVGGFITLIGIVSIFLLPIQLSKKNKLIDHTTFGSELMKVRESKRVKAFEILFIGISVVLIIGIAELLVHIF